MDKPMIFARSVLLSMEAKEGIMLAIIMHMKAMLPSLVAWSTNPGIGLLKSTGNFMATDMTRIREAISAIQLSTDEKKGKRAGQNAGRESHVIRAVVNHVIGKPLENRRKTVEKSSVSRRKAVGK
ncbi:hypothetical protein OSB04_022567 [Centaurea solstitialis]|uniref:Uncharacterized protein n=1 Tax=Centaurea solstitialis TaxID=347529 RepID=A0AA38WHD7_9ASTR|nr:hypothetical protein OSB04_022567 [Centaurea solstitialis]